MLERSESTPIDPFADAAAAQAYAKRAARTARFMYRSALGHIVELAPRRLLDLGAGPGLLAMEAARRLPTLEVVAVERSPAMAGVAEGRVRAAGLADRVRVVTGDACDATLAADVGFFDLVVSTYCLHHFAEPVRALRVAARAAPAGTVLFQDLRPVGWLRWIPFRGDFLDSLRASFAKARVEDVVARAPGRRWEVIEEPPFLLTVIGRPPV